MKRNNYQITHKKILKGKFYIEVLNHFGSKELKKRIPTATQIKYAVPEKGGVFYGSTDGRTTYIDIVG